MTLIGFKKCTRFGGDPMKRKYSLALLFVACFVLASWSIAAESEEGGKKKNFIWPELKVLDRYYGAWRLVERHYGPDGKLVATIEGHEEAPWMLDDRAIQRRYISGNRLGLYRARGMFTWNRVESRYEGVWFDNASSGGMRPVVGEWDPKKTTMTYRMETKTASGETQVFRVVDYFRDAGHRVTTTYRLDGDEKIKVLEVIADRLGSCTGDGTKVMFGG